MRHRPAPRPGREPAGPDDDGPLLCFHAATARLPDGRYETAGGRVLALVGRGATMRAARDAAYRGAANVALDGGRYRSDIASRELAVGDGAQLGHEAG